MVITYVSFAYSKTFKFWSNSLVTTLNKTFMHLQLFLECIKAIMHVILISETLNYVISGLLSLFLLDL